MGVDKFIQNQADGRGEMANVAPTVDKLKNQADFNRKHMYTPNFRL